MEKYIHVNIHLSSNPESEVTKQYEEINNLQYKLM